MFDIVVGLDVLGLGFLLGALLFLAGLVKVLLENRSFEDLNRAYLSAAEPPSPVSTRTAPPAQVSASAENSPDPDGGSPVRPPRTRRAA